jgi:hypothetical protein
VHTCNSLVSCLNSYFYLLATPLHCYSSAVLTLHQQLLYTHITPLSAASSTPSIVIYFPLSASPLHCYYSATPLSAASATPSIVTFLSQLLLYTATPQLYYIYSHFISNSFTRMQLPHLLPVPVLLPLKLLFSLSNSSTLLLRICTYTSSATPLQACNSLVRCQCNSLYSYFSQLLLYTVTPQLYPYFISNSSTHMQLPCQLPQ